MSVTAPESNHLAVQGVVGDSPVDRKNAIIRGRVVAELGPFKTPNRGRFTMESLQKIVELGKLAEAQQSGLKGHIQHANLSDDGTGKFLSRDRNFRIVDGKVLSDVHINKTALKAPPGGGGTPWGEYLMDLVESDPGAISSSLVVPHTEEYELDAAGNKVKGPDGKPLPPIWMPTELKAIDVVDTGDAVNNFLSTDMDIDHLPDAVVRNVSGMLDHLFANLSATDVQAKAQGFLSRYLTGRFGENALSPVSGTNHKESDSMDEATAKRIAALEDSNAKLATLITAQNEMLSAIGKSLTEEREQNAKAAAAEIRRAKIHTLGTQAGFTAAEIATAVADDGLSVLAFAEKAVVKACEKNALSNGDGTGDGTGGDVNLKYKAEFKRDKNIHDSLGVTEADYIAHRRIEDGHDDMPDLLSIAIGNATKVA